MMSKRPGRKQQKSILQKNLDFETIKIFIIKWLNITTLVVSGLMFIMAFLTDANYFQFSIIFFFSDLLIMGFYLLKKYNLASYLLITLLSGLIFWRVVAVKSINNIHYIGIFIIFAAVITDTRFINIFSLALIGALFYLGSINYFSWGPIINPENNLQYTTAVAQVLPTILGSYGFALVLQKIIFRIMDAQKASRDYLSNVLETLGEGVFVVDIKGNILSLNEEAIQIFRSSQSREHFKKIEDIFELAEPSSKELLKADWLMMLEKQLPFFNSDYAIPTQEGEIVILEATITPMHDAGGKIIGFVFIIRDVSERRRMEEEFYKNQRIESIGVLAGGFAHDFNNLLTPIIGNLSLAKMDLIKTCSDDKREKLRDSLIEAEEAALKAKNLTLQLLTFSKGGNPIKEHVSLPDLIIESAKFPLHGSQSGIKYFFSEYLWEVEVDPGQFGQVIQNLVLNAVQAMQGEGNISIDGSNVNLPTGNQYQLVPGRYVSISITDTGCGISPEDLPKIFDIYFTTKSDGNGLGLSICMAIMKKHSGIISVKSQVGEGSTFMLTVPASSTSHSDVRGVPLEKINFDDLPEKRALVLEDHKSIQRSLAKLLARLNIKAEFYKNGREMVQNYGIMKEKGEIIDFLILDLTIPGGMGGQETIKEIRLIDPDIPAIVSSGYSTGIVLGKFMEYGFQGVLVKPYTIEKLGKTLLNIPNLYQKE